MLLLVVIMILMLVVVMIVINSVSLYSLDCPGDQAGLKLRNLSAPASQVLGLKAWTTTARITFC